MRVVYFLVLLAFVVAVGIFVYQNDATTNVHFANRSVAWPLSLVVGLAYLAGMFSGWSVFGMLRRSFERVADRTPQR
jgi:uncharacterized integral membrane protein